MKLRKIGICLSLLFVFMVSTANAVMAVPSTGTKKLDLSKFHNVGNIWLRVSNYGFFGSGDDVVPQYPSLEYPGGSGTDYLYQGALWFGAKKQRRDTYGNKLYWPVYPPPDGTQPIPSSSPLWDPTMQAVLDTLVTVGFDGDADLYEFLPAYNPLLVSNPDMSAAYDLYNPLDGMATASTRFNRRGVDDDGDGKVDEDMVGYSFPMRQSVELPEDFAAFGGKYLNQLSNSTFGILNDPANLEIWYPLGFQELAFDNFPLLYPPQIPSHEYAFTNPRDDDGDGRLDEDGAPVSEQDYVSYYYDYCPFNSPGERDHGSSKPYSKHIPLDVRVRQMSYQWSFEYIKNLVYVEFNITNMNKEDTLIDCAMGIYMDADVGPQTWGPEKASDDKSGYVKGEGYEFAYTFDADFDGGLSPGYVGARVCSPNPEKLQFHCWYWVVGNGPNDEDTQDLSPVNKTSNEKYWLLTGKNPNIDKYTPLRPESISETEYVQQSANDTRFLFAFYGAQPGTADYADPEKQWNLAPGKTMKIVVAVFPGDTIADLKKSANWAKEVYGRAQELVDVVKPDIYTHYNPPEPPEIPKLYAEVSEDGDFGIDLYWDNRSEFYTDVKTVTSAVMGWQFPLPDTRIPGLDSDPALYPGWVGIPEEFQPDPINPVYNNQALVNPYTANRLRHDFQGYSIWGRSGSGNREDWEMVKRWDKKDTAQDILDYSVNNAPQFIDHYRYFGGYLGIDTDLPNKNVWVPETPGEYTKFYHYNDKYDLIPLTSSDPFYGYPIYNPDLDYNDPTITPAVASIDAAYPDNYQYRQLLKARLFKHKSMRLDVFDQLYDAKLIPLAGMGFAGDTAPTAAEINKLKGQRLARRYYRSEIPYPKKGVEYYVAVTAFDRGIPSVDLDYLESGRDADANMKVFFPGSVAKEDMKNIMVIPNPYIGRSKFDGRRENDEKGDKSRRLWFVNLPYSCNIRIYTLAGDLVQQLDHEGASETDIITISRASPYKGMSATGMHSWNLLTKNNQIIAPGVYLFSVENKADGKIKVGKFVVVK